MNKLHVRYHSLDNRLHFKRMESDPVEIPFDIHNRWELIYLKSGEVTYTVNGKAYQLREDWLIITRSLNSHSILCTGKEPYDRYVVQFEEADISSDICEIFPQNLDVLYCGAEGGIREVFEKIAQYVQMFEEKTVRIMVLHLIEEILCDAKLLIDRSKDKYESPCNTTVAQAVEYIKENIYRPVRVEEVAEQLFVSAGHLHYLFMQYMQVPPKQYITTLKLTLAYRVLCNGQKATRVCTKYGFPDYSGFYRQYLRYFGHKPSEAEAYQKNLGTHH